MALLKYLILLLINHYVFSSNLDDPCGGLNPVKDTEGQGSNTDLSTALTGIVNAALEAKEWAGLLKRKYSNMSDSHVRISDRTASQLDNYHIHNSTYTRKQLDTVSETLQQDYFDVSVIAVFMERIYRDELEVSSSANNFLFEMNRFKSAVLKTLCKIKIPSGGLDLVAADDSLMPRWAPTNKRMDTTTRYQRDYVIFKDAEIYLGALSSNNTL